MLDLSDAGRPALRLLAGLDSPELAPLRDLFADLALKTQEKLVYAKEEDVIRRLQGRAETFLSIVAAVEQAKAMVR